MYSVYTLCMYFVNFVGAICAYASHYVPTPVANTAVRDNRANLGRALISLYP